MKPQVLFALIVGASLGTAVHAQQVLSHFTASSYENTSSPADGGWDQPGHRAGSLRDDALSSEWAGDFGSRQTDRDHVGHNYERGGGSELYAPSAGHSADRDAFGKFDDFDNDERNGYRRTGWGQFRHHLPSDCSPIPEPPVYAALLGGTVFGLAVLRRKLGMG